MPSPPRPKEANYSITLEVVLIIVFLLVACVSVGFCMDGSPESALFLAVGVIAIVAQVKQINRKKQERDEIEKDNRAAIRAYEDRCKAIKKDYEKQIKEYKINLENSKKEYEHSKKVYKNAEVAVSLLEKPLKETQETLDRLYSVGWIFPKYQNYVAVCSFYEYFLTGRCAILTGPDGAYNLYESELRQNMIINRLDRIIDSLDKIKENQYTLYTEMKRAYKTIEGIGEDVKGILSETKSISDATHIAAANSEITAKNTEAIKYISLINGVNGAKEIHQ